MCSKTDLPQRDRKRFIVHSDTSLRLLLHRPVPCISIILPWKLSQFTIEFWNRKTGTLRSVTARAAAWIWCRWRVRKNGSRWPKCCARRRASQRLEPVTGRLPPPAVWDIMEHISGRLEHSMKRKNNGSGRPAVSHSISPTGNAANRTTRTSANRCSSFGEKSRSTGTISVESIRRTTGRWTLISFASREFSKCNFFAVLHFFFLIFLKNHFCHWRCLKHRINTDIGYERVQTHQLWNIDFWNKSSNRHPAAGIVKTWAGGR